LAVESPNPCYLRQSASYLFLYFNQQILILDNLTDKLKSYVPFQTSGTWEFISHNLPRFLSNTNQALTDSDSDSDAHLALYTTPTFTSLFIPTRLTPRLNTLLNHDMVTLIKPLLLSRPNFTPNSTPLLFTSFKFLSYIPFNYSPQPLQKTSAPSTAQDLRRYPLKTRFSTTHLFAFLPSRLFPNPSTEDSRKQPHGPSHTVALPSPIAIIVMMYW
jgi:hypothetical protein